MKLGEVLTRERIGIQLLLLVLLAISCKAVSNNAFAESPSFERQVIIDQPNDSFLIRSRMDTSPVYTSDGNVTWIQNGKNLQDCTPTKQHRFYDISAVSYFSNGKTLNATIWLYHPLIQPPLNASEWLTPPIINSPWYRIIYGMAIGIQSAYDAKGGDYHVRDVWNVNGRGWTTILAEMPPPPMSNTKISYIKGSSSGLLEGAKNYTELSLNLDSITYPDRYSLLFYTHYIFIKDRHLCFVSDISSEVSIPPPQFIISTSPNNIELRPGEDKTIRFQVKSNTVFKSEASIAANQSDDIKLSVSPKKVSIPPNGLATSRLHIEVSDSAQPLEHLLPLSANMSIITGSKMRGSVVNDITRDSVRANITEDSDLILTVLPPLRPSEHLNNFVEAWITPVGGMWTFLAGIAAVIGPLVVRLYAKKKQNKDKIKKLGEWFDVSK